MRRLEMLKPSPSATTLRPSRTASKLYSGSPMPIMTTLETRRFSPVAGRRRRALPIVQPVARQHDLADDLAWREIAHEALCAGMAERAIERAADLTGNAQRAAVGFGDVDALDLTGPAVGFAGKPQQPLARAVDGDLLRGDLRPRRREMLRQLGAQLFRQRRHRGKILRAAHVEPVPDLLHPHALLPLRHADAAERRSERVARQPDQRRLIRRDILLERPLLDESSGRGAVGMRCGKRRWSSESDNRHFTDR